MTSVAYLSEQLVILLEERADELAREMGCVQRQRQFSGASLLQTLVFGWQQHPDASLENLASVAALHDVLVTDTVVHKRTALVEAAHAATHCKESYLAAQYHRLVLRRGGKKATIALGHTFLVIVYHVLADEKDYQERGGNYFDVHDRQAVQKRLVHRLEKLGYEVTLAPISPAA